MTRLGLTLNETKTELKDARKECFDFLGYAFGPEYHRKKGYQYLSAGPSRKSVLAIMRQRFNRTSACRKPGPGHEPRQAACP